VQRVNHVVDFRLERNVSKGLTKETTRSGLERTLRERGKVEVSASVGTWGCELLKGKRIVETKVAAYNSFFYV
jgi:hypothetical protein